MFQSRIVRRGTSLFAACCSLLVLSMGNSALAENYALTSTVINNSGSYPGLPDFPVTNVIDGQNVTTPQYGQVAQDVFGDSVTPGSASYWLTPDSQGAGSFFTLDLGQTENIGQFRIANTRNTNYGDRGTLEFSVLASNSVDGFNNLVAPVTLISDQSIPLPSDPSNIPFQVYSPSSGIAFGGYRYVEFLTVEAQGSTLQMDGSFVGGNGGLNEFQVISAVPEPSSLSLWCLGAVGLFVAARRRLRNA
jgi:hypothetical protein